MPDSQFCEATELRISRFCVVSVANLLRCAARSLSNLRFQILSGMDFDYLFDDRHDEAQAAIHHRKGGLEK
jgi:hypothetical protein